MIKLHLGCGTKKLHGFINVDIRPEVHPDLVCDITNISSKYKEGVDLIYACHVLEHFPTKVLSCYSGYTWKDVLIDWHRALKVGGILRLSVPDFRAACEHYLTTGKIQNLYGLLYGGQKNPFDYHFHCWDFETLKSSLEEMGFACIARYDWRTTEHSHVDDYSQAYLPHMDKINGKLMSLNIEAVKL